MFLDYPQLILFLTATVLLNLTPGNDVLYVASQSFHSRQKGILAALGVTAGLSIYILAVAFGLVEVLRYSPTAFNVIKYVGAAYLLYLAYQALFSTNHSVLTPGENQTSQRSFYKGIYTTLLNPKCGIFFLTFFPQFLDVNLGKIWLQSLFLGLCFILSATTINIVYAFLFASAKERVFSKMQNQKWLDWLIAGIFFGLAMKILTTDR